MLNWLESDYLLSGILCNFLRCKTASVGDWQSCFSPTSFYPDGKEFAGELGSISGPMFINKLYPLVLVPTFCALIMLLWPFFL